MMKSSVVLMLALATPGGAAEPYRPLPRLSQDEVKRRAAAQPAPPAPGEEPSASDAPGPSAAQGDAVEPAPSAGPPVGSDALEPSAPPSLDTFRQGLSPYGSWAWSREYGWTWQPRVGTDWKPYYRGQWVWTDIGWAPLWAGWPSFAVGFPFGSRFFAFVPFHRFHGFPVHRFAFAPRFHPGLFPRAFPAPRLPSRMSSGPPWGGARGFASRPFFRGVRVGPMGRRR